MHAFRAAAEQEAGYRDQEPRKRDIGQRRDDQQKFEQANQAVWRTSTPLSLRACCNSPAWNISRTMSQPPTNSPFT
jgi:hypothetical protein